MKRLIRIPILLICIFLCNVVLFTPHNCYASYLGVVNTWNSNYDSIGRWNISNPSVRTSKLNTNGNFSFISEMTSAISSWNSALGTSIYATNSDAAKIKAYGGTIDELAAIGYILSTGTDGYTNSEKTEEGYWMYNYTLPKGSYIITSAEVCVVDNAYSNYNCTQPCYHELGHALGWLGHSPNNNDIMYFSNNYKTSLTARDKNHLSQIYP